MPKYCPMCDQITNCTDNCKSCLEEEKKERKQSNDQIQMEIHNNG